MKQIYYVIQYKHVYSDKPSICDYPINLAGLSNVLSAAFMLNPLVFLDKLHVMSRFI